MYPLSNLSSCSVNKPLAPEVFRASVTNLGLRAADYRPDRERLSDVLQTNRFGSWSCCGESEGRPCQEKAQVVLVFWKWWVGNYWRNIGNQVGNSCGLLSWPSLLSLSIPVSQQILDGWHDASCHCSSSKARVDTTCGLGLSWSQVHPRNEDPCLIANQDENQMVTRERLPLYRGGCHEAPL